MKILVEHGEFDENEVVLKCRVLDEEMLEVLALLKERPARVAVYCGGETHMLQPADIYYAETVDGKVFVCTKDLVAESCASLTALQETYADAGILRVGKSQLVNLHYVKKLKSLPNSRIEITLKNNERMIVSRHYVQNLKEKLGMS